MTTRWTSADLARIGRSEELEIASYRPDGTLRPYVTIWGVQVGEDFVVRSAYGSGNPWFRRAVAAGQGRVRAGGVERDVLFVSAAGVDHSAVDAAYHRKYDRYGSRIVGSVTGPAAPPTTLRLVPQT